MKIRYFFAALVVGSFGFAGCATETTTTTTTTAQTQADQTTRRVHTQDELRKTGETETGPALEKVDPAVSVSH